MMTTLYYFLQVAICSAVLYAYYLLVLRNKRFHQYNRYYLLMILLISWLVPLIRIPVKAIAGSTTSQGMPFRFFNVIADSNSHLETYVSTGTASFTWDTVFMYGYWMISLVIAMTFIAGLLRIWFLLKKNPCRHIDKAVLVTTTVKSAPFSFFRFIFWKDEIDISSNVGRQILSHEMVHVKEKHSLDKMIAAMVLSIGWINPVFWLVKKELDMVHEFIADKKAVNEDASDLAAMLLTASYPSVNFSLTNSFFHSPVKRRLSMMNRFSITKYSWPRRLMILPLLAVVVMLFAFRKQVATIVWIDPVENIVVKKLSSSDTSRVIVTDLRLDENLNVSPAPVELEKVYKVMVDVGHGGYDMGAQAPDGTKESEISLEIAKVFVEEYKHRKNEKIILVLTRMADVYQSPTDKAGSVKRSDPDLFVSIHAGFSEDKTDNGIGLFIPRGTLRHYKASYLFANTLANTFSGSNDSKVEIRQRNTGTWLINAINCPAVLIETGYLSNEADLTKLKDKNYQRELVKTLWNGIELYLQRMDAQ